jgi:hypothetical protein
LKHEIFLLSILQKEKGKKEKYKMDGKIKRKIERKENIKWTENKKK